MQAPGRVVLVFVVVFFALIALVGAFGLLGVWELLLIAAVAASLTAVITRVWPRRAPPVA